MPQSPDLVMCTAEILHSLIDEAEQGWKREKLVNEYLTADLVRSVDQLRKSPVRFNFSHNFLRLLKESANNWELRHHFCLRQYSKKYIMNKIWCP